MPDKLVFGQKPRRRGRRISAYEQQIHDQVGTALRAWASDNHMILENVTLESSSFTGTCLHCGAVVTQPITGPPVHVCQNAKASPQASALGDELAQASGTDAESLKAGVDPELPGETDAG